MKICIVGAGAVGGMLGTRLAAAGEAELTAIARGATLAALRTHGWRLREAGRLIHAPAQVAEHPAQLGVQDVVLIAVKGPALAPVAQSIAPLLGPHSVVLPAMNGVPWWFCDGIAALAGAPLASVDAGGHIAAAIPVDRVIGSVVHASVSTSAPGLVEHAMGRGLILGEARGGKSARVEALAGLFARAGFEVSHSGDIRRDIWYKLWGNMTLNPVSALTGATGDRILADPLLRAFCAAAMREAAAIGARLGCPIEQDPEQRFAISAKLGAFRTSMLQDAEAGRALELDALVGAVHELGLRLGLATPNIDAIFGLARLYGRTHGLYASGE
ncbi:MAG: 2-dehydropantoate 2-reductase [Rhodocyclaceae bacterium]|nr:2-dehydropantoate 2-reductase [Rhodocyclaceae bacterium]MBX3668952.1 2-dehydropantoate 2-reductase [Rhodocyclaceae bacterium]